MEKNVNESPNIVRGLILEVPFKEKDLVKELGAWWDPDLKKWFVPQGKDTKPFARWFPKENSAAQSERRKTN